MQQKEEDVDEDEDEEFGEENVGQWSPEPISAEQIVGLDVISEEDDLRLLELQRAQVTIIAYLLSSGALHVLLLLLPGDIM